MQLADKMINFFSDLKKDTTFVNITNVANWLMLENSQRHWDYHTDFPAVLSPWKRSWYEYNIPRLTKKNGRLETNPSYDQGVRRLGVFVETTEFNNDKHREFLLDVMRKKEARFFVSAKIFIEFNEHGVFDLGTVIDFLSEQGKPILGERKVRLSDEVKRVSKERLQKDVVTLEREVAHYLLPLYMAISLCHTKNVTLVDTLADPKVIKKRLDRGKDPGVIYKTITISTMTKALSNLAREKNIVMSKAFHLCRGHFRTYTESAPLFGRLTGTYWVPMHTKGSKKFGEVVKDYKINS